MRQTVVKAVIVVFALICILVVSLFVFIGDPNHYEELDSLAQRFDRRPKPEHLRDLLNYPAGDGAYSYYQSALTGASFSKYPQVFREVFENLQTESERYLIEQLESRGSAVFEYHPELKPKEFDDRFEANSWLRQKLNK